MIYIADHKSNHPPLFNTVGTFYSNKYIIYAKIYRICQNGLHTELLLLLLLVLFVTSYGIVLLLLYILFIIFQYKSHKPLH
jgi:hypothetical protein